MVWDESNIVIERNASKMINESNLMQQTIGAVLSKKGQSARAKTIKQINVHTVPFEHPTEGQDEEI